MKNYILLSLLLCITTIFSCKKNNTILPSNDEQIVKADIFGQVIDEMGNPVFGAVVKTSTHTCITDSDGVFQFTQINTSRRNTKIEVTKPTYFNGHRTMYIIPNQDNFTVIRLIEKKNSSTFNAVSGGLIQVNGGGAINFPPNSLVNKATGLPYTGQVTVYSSWIDPTSDKLGELIPGALRGQDNNNEEKLLESYGMIGAELYDDNNQALQIAPNHTAQISFPIPSTLGVNAPSTIPLWYFDETKGTWLEQGSAQKQGNNYIGEVSHFSFWNCDIPLDFVQFDATIRNSNGTPLLNALVKITDISNSTSRSSLTNSQGRVTGAIPKNANLSLEVLLDNCSTVLYSSSFTTNTSNITMNNVIVSVPNINQIILAGTVLNCTNEICKNGYVKFKHNNTIKVIKASSNGSFYIASVECTTPISVKLTAYDLDEEQAGFETSLLLSSGLNQIGNLNACGNEFAQFIKCVNIINGAKTSFTITDLTGYFEGGINNDHGQPLIGCAAVDSMTLNAIGFSFDGPQSISGNHYLKFYSDHLDYDWTKDTTYSYFNTIIPVVLTKYEAIGGKIEGSFSGSIKGLNIPNRIVNCTFRVNRTQ